MANEMTASGVLWEASESRTKRTLPPQVKQTHCPTPPPQAHAANEGVAGPPPEGIRESSEQKRQCGVGCKILDAVDLDQVGRQPE